MVLPTPSPPRHPGAPRRSLPLLLVILLTATVGRPSAAGAQTLVELTATPDSAAEMFIRSVRASRWSAAAQFIDPETLGLFRDVVTMTTEVDESGALLEYLVGTDSAGYPDLDAPEVFDRALTTVTGDMPGLTHSLHDRDDEVLGHVVEAADTAHVVYRTQMRISGSVSEIKVMQLRRGPEGWRVFWSDELDVLETALRGAARLR